MNRLERAAYNLLLEHPKAKSLLTYCYRFGFYWMPSSGTESQADITLLSNLFFGFHDKSPWSPDNKSVLAHRFNGPGSAKIRARGSVEIGYVDTDSGKFTPLAHTGCHNWQLGAMLQWRFDTGHTQQALYHDLSQGRIVTNLIDMSSRRMAQFPFPISSTDRSGRYAVLINPAMHGIVEPQYGYHGVTSPYSDDMPYGLSVLLMESRELVINITLEQLIEGLPATDRLSKEETYISHPQFCPNGTKVSFFVRQKQGQMRHRTYLVSLGIADGIFTVADLSDYVSHYSWLNDSKIIVYARDNAGRYGYFLIDTSCGSSEHLGWIDDMGDGHPQTYAGTSQVITDTYPDKYGLQHLMLLDVHLKSVTPLLSLKIPLRFRGPRRCDFHPRWDRQGRSICFDSAHSGRRSLCMVDLEKLLTPEVQNGFDAITAGS